MLALQLNLTKAQDDFAALCKRYKEKHPKYIQATTLIGELKGDITNAVLSSVQPSRPASTAPALPKSPSTRR